MSEIENLLIREVRDSDLPGLEWEGEFVHFRRLFATAFRESRMGRAVLWVAVLPNGRLIGQAFVQLDSSNKEIADGKTRAYVHGVRVRPECRKMGVATHLMISLEMDLVNRGFLESTLNVGRENTPARQLYEKLGYRIVGADAGEWSYIDHTGKRCHVCEPAWRMIKKITAA